MTEIKIKLKDSKVTLPKFETPLSAGRDLKAHSFIDYVTRTNNEVNIDLGKSTFILKPGYRVKIGTGIFIELPSGVEAQIRCRSGKSYRHGLVLANKLGTIDADYRGEVCVLMTNTSAVPLTLKIGDKIAQMVIAKVEDSEFKLTEYLSDSERGDGGFGSTDKPGVESEELLG